MRLRYAIPVMLVLSLALGCRKKTVPQTTETTSTTTGMVFAVGQKVDVKWNGKWWQGEVLAVNPATYHVHYTGWSAKWDEDVTPDRVRTSSTEASVGTEIAQGGGVTTPGAAWKAGDNVDVSWNGTWWQAKILSVNGALYRVHYVGWASSWDENVTVARIRAASGTGKKGTGPI